MKKLIHSNNIMEAAIILIELSSYLNQYLIHAQLLPPSLIEFILLTLINILAMFAFYQANSRFERCSEDTPDNQKMYCKTCKDYIVGRDHHCMFIGRCVDRANYRYYLTYVLYSYVLSAWLLVSIALHYRLVYLYYLLGYQTDVFCIGYGLASGLFFLIMTGGLFSDSLRLMVQNVKKVEQIKSLKEPKFSKRQLMLKMLTPCGMWELYKEFKKNWERQFGSPFSVSKILLPFL